MLTAFLAQKVMPSKGRKRSAAIVLEHNNIMESENKKLRRVLEEASDEFICPITVRHASLPHSVPSLRFALCSFHIF